jgi:hypothetical protein
MKDELKLIVILLLAIFVFFNRHKLSVDIMKSRSRLMKSLDNEMNYDIGAIVLIIVSMGFVAIAIHEYLIKKGWL